MDNFKFLNYYSSHFKGYCWLCCFWLEWLCEDCRNSLYFPEVMLGVCVQDIKCVGRDCGGLSEDVGGAMYDSSNLRCVSPLNTKFIQ